MTSTHDFAKQELDLLAETTPDAVVIEFYKEILALCEAFGSSGQSGGSAPFVAQAIADTVKKLCLFEPICKITGDESEWVDMTGRDGERVWQNARCSALFKNENGECEYLDAIVWHGEEDYDTFTGSVYVDEQNWELIRSRQKVKFPFSPKTFYVNVVRVPVSKEEAELSGLYYIQDGFDECYYTILKDPKQLEEVFDYYIK